MGPFEAIEKLVNEHGSAAVLKERIELAKDQYAALERQVADLTKKLEIVESQNALLSGKLEKASAPEEFTKVNGLLWRQTNIGFEPSPYCPRCKTVMHQFPPNARMYWTCSKCDFQADWAAAPNVPGLPS
jgi:hypothetical protein